MTWWAAQVASNKEYDTKREIVSGHLLEEDDVFIPRLQTYEMKGDELAKKTETMIPGYLLLKLGNTPALNGLESLNNYIKIIGPITEEEMENIKEHENIPEDLEASTGDKIIVTKGPFTGVKGNIMEEYEDIAKYKCRLVFHGNEIEVDLDASIIEKIS
jgi:transcription antitermination factor NusG